MRLPDSLSRDAQLAWLAGLLDGEGSFGFYPGGTGLQVRLRMTDEDVVAEAARVAGVGTLSGPYTKGRNKPLYQWTVSRTKDALALMGSLRPMLCARRQAQIDTAIDTYGRTHVSA